MQTGSHMAETETEFDEVLMRRQAVLLNEEAERAVVTTMIVVGAIGVIIGGFAFDFFAERSELFAILTAVGIPALAAIVGGFMGESRALKSRAHAQQLLALVAIESNTRRSSIAINHPVTAAHSQTN